MSVASFSDWLSYEPNFNQHKAQIINKLRWYENETHRLQARIAELESRPTPEQSGEARDARNIESYRIWAISEGVTTTTLGYKIWRAAIDAAMDRSALGREG